MGFGSTGNIVAGRVGGGNGVDGGDNYGGDSVGISCGTAWWAKL